MGDGISIRHTAGVRSSDHAQVNAEVRRRWLAIWREADIRFREMKASSEALLELYRRYAELSSADRAEVDRLLAETLLSDDANLRFDALALIEEFHIASARPELRLLAKRLPRSKSPGAPYELAKVQRIIDLLGRSYGKGGAGISRSV